MLPRLGGVTETPAIATAPRPRTIRPQHVAPVALSAVAAATGGVLVGSDDAVTGVTLASLDVRPGDLFVGIRGAKQHGAAFSADAAERGAIAVLTDSEGAAYAQAAGLPAIVVASPREVLGAASALVYAFEEGHPALFAVTGTNGKTSTVHLLEGIAAALGETTGLSSTAERRIAGSVEVSGLTTPEASDMHALIAAMREQSVTVAAIEVSAQALSRHRVDGIRFDVAGFTNLSHDHFDDYGDFEVYFAQKALLFTPERARTGVVSLDSKWGAQIVARAGVPTTTIASLPDVGADWRVTTLEVAREGTRFRLVGPAGESLETAIPAIGAHHAANAGLAIVMLVAGGIPFPRIAAAIGGGRELPPLPGRTENVAGPGAPAVFVDFGHSPDAFAKTLDAVREVTAGKVIMVFGADGDRDKTKRADMAAEAVRRSDILVITDHHPRFEDPAAIRKALVLGAIEARPDAEIHVVSPPPRAIRVAVSLAGPDDSILWAGPGHQNYREIEGVKTAYSAREEARQALEEHGYMAKR